MASLTTMFNNVRSTLAYWFLQYELVTCTYMFEPWEKLLFHTTTLFLISLVTYSSITYLPTYTLSLWSNVTSWLQP
uniref:Serine palmitoyltransferase small subunit B n=1 Tax=Panstrongylus lignarius TaxID=156445 RepID=A0A224XX54_9HEMI